MRVLLLILQPQCSCEVIQVSVGAFALQTTWEAHQIVQGLGTSCERETLENVSSQVKESTLQKRKVHKTKQVKR